MATVKALSNWGHPCIFEEGFAWDLKREGAYPHMYQIKVDGIKVCRVRVLWDAGNMVCSKFLGEDTWYRLTGYALEEEKKGDLAEFLCFFGESAPYHPTAMAYVGIRKVQAMCRGLGRINMRVAAAERRARGRVSACKSPQELEDEGAWAQDAPEPKRGSSMYESS